MRQKIIIDGRLIRTEYEIHELLKKNLEFPDYYGMNLDALWDMLTAWVKYPIIIEWGHFQESEKYLGRDIALSILGVFQEAEKEIDGMRLIVEK